MPLEHPPAPPLYALKEDDKAALAVISALVFLIYAIIGIVLKLVIRLNITSLQSHDVVLLGSIVLLFVQTILVITACNRGLGRHQDTVDSGSLETFYKLVYASSLLAVAAAAATKISLCLLIQSINNHGRFHVTNRVLIGVIIAWGLSSVVAEAFQCSLPRPWLAVSSERCPGREAIFLYNGIADILTDTALCVLPIAMMWKVQTTTRRKLLVIALFGTRVIVPIVSVPGLISTRRFVTDYADATWHAVPHVIWLQCSLGLSVFTACIPSLKGVIDSLLGSTSVAAIQAPYELTSSRADKSSRLHATAIAGGSSSRRGSHLASGVANSRTTRTKSARPADWQMGRQTQGHDGSKEKGDGACSDSVRKLTESDEDLVPQGDDGRSSSQEGSVSLESSKVEYRM